MFKFLSKTLSAICLTILSLSASSQYSDYSNCAIQWNTASEVPNINKTYSEHNGFAWVLADLDDIFDLPGYGKLIPIGDNDGVLAKIDAKGNWVEVYTLGIPGTFGTVTLKNISISGDSIYVTGGCGQNLTIAGTTVKGQFVACFSKTLKKWTSAKSLHESIPFDNFIATDTAIYFLANTRHNTAFEGQTYNSTGHDYFLVNYKPTDYSLSWAKMIPDVQNRLLYPGSLISKGASWYVAGKTTDSTDLVIVKFQDQGKLSWTKKLKPLRNAFYGFAGMAISKTGKLFLGGAEGGLISGADTITGSLLYSLDTLTGNLIGSESNKLIKGEVTGITSDPNGEIYISGNTRSSYNPYIESNGLYHNAGAFIAQYKDTNAFEWYISANKDQDIFPEELTHMGDRQLITFTIVNQDDILICDEKISHFGYPTAQITTCPAPAKFDKPVLYDVLADYNGHTSSTKAVAIDSKGNSYFAGNGNGYPTTIHGIKYEGNFLFKLDPTGKTVWVKEYKSQFAIKLIKVDSDESVYLAGNLFMSKYSKNGELLWNVTATNVLNPSEVNGLTFDPVSNLFYLTGNVSVSPSDIGMFGDKSFRITGPFLATIDKSGSVKNIFQANTKGGTTFTDCKIFNNKVYITGYGQKLVDYGTGISFTGFGDGNRAFLLITDLALKPLKIMAEKSTPAFFADNQLTSIHVASANEIFLCGEAQEFKWDTFEITGTYNNVFLIKVDSTGKFINGKQFPGPNGFAKKPLVQHGANLAMSLAGTFFIDSTIYNKGYYGHYIAEFDQNINLVEYKQILNGTVEAFAFGAKRMVVGGEFSDNIGPGAGFVCYSDTVFGCNEFATLGIEEAKAVDNSTTNTLQVYPNPGTGIVTVRLKESVTEEGLLQVFSLQGALQFETNMQNETVINLTNLSSGYYIIKFQTNKEAISGKVLKY